MRVSMNLGIKLGGMLTAILLAWPLPGCSPSQVPPTTEQTSDVEAVPARHKTRAPAHDEATPGVPDKVKKTLDHIDKNHEAPAGYEGGRRFHNEGRGGEQQLPQKDKKGNAISYQEWDVNPKVHGVNRGAERLVTGSDGSAYFTSDHYRTFTKIR